MSKVILLDTHPLSQVTHPKINPKVKKWLDSLQHTETFIRVPEIADYELRRELLRQRKQKSIERLNQLSQICLIPLTSATMRKAAEPGHKSETRDNLQLVMIV